MTSFAERIAQLRQDPKHIAWVERCLAARVEQGLPEHVEDDETIDFIAAALLGARPENRARGGRDAA